MRMNFSLPLFHCATKFAEWIFMVQPEKKNNNNKIANSRNQPVLVVSKSAGGLGIECREKSRVCKKKVGKVLCKHRNLHTYWFSHFSLHFTAAQFDSWDVTSSIENIMKQWMKRSIIRSGLRVDLTCVCDRMCRTMQTAPTDIASRWRTYCVCIFNSNDNIIRLLPWMHRARIVSRPSNSYCVSLTTTENSQSKTLYGGEMTRQSRWGKKYDKLKVSQRCGPRLQLSNWTSHCG